MRIEIASAANFLVDLLRLSNANLSESQLAKFRENVCECLVRHYRDHWFPETPVKGSGYRCIRINGKMDPLISRAGVMMGIAEKFLRSLFPSELTMWVDPAEVSYRIGENGSICVLYEDDLSSSSASSSPVSSTSSSSPSPSSKSSSSMGSPSPPRQPPAALSRPQVPVTSAVAVTAAPPQQLQSVVAMSNSPQGQLPSALSYTPSKGVVQMAPSTGTQSPPPPPPQQPLSSSSTLQHQQHLHHHPQVSMLTPNGGIVLKDPTGSGVNCKESLQRSMTNLGPRILMLDRLSTYVSS